MQRPALVGWAGTNAARQSARPRRASRPLPMPHPTHNAALDVVTFGEAMLLLVADQPGPLEAATAFHKRSAGAETNVAIGLARLGLAVGWASRLGADSMGRYLLATLRAEGIDCSHVVCDPGQRTGFMFKGKVADGGDPPIEYHRTGSAASRVGPADVDEPWLRSARHLHATGVFPALSDSCMAAAQRAIAVMREAGRSVSFDPNLRPQLWPSVEAMRAGVNRLAAQADWVLPGLDEGRLLTGASTPEGIALHYRNAGAKLCAITESARRSAISSWCTTRNPSATSAHSAARHASRNASPIGGAGPSSPRPMRAPMEGFDVGSPHDRHSTQLARMAGTC